MQLRHLALLNSLYASFSYGLKLLPSMQRPKRVLWKGSFWGRLPANGRKFLISEGWKVLDDENISHSQALNPEQCEDGSIVRSTPLALVWPSKSGPQFSTDQLYPALVRPLPANATSCLDDKISLTQLIDGSNIGPEIISQPYEDHLASSDDSGLYFVKHRWGAQGKSVYAFDKDQLLRWYKTSRNAHDFVIQKEVPPVLDEQGRKFVLRSHLLLVVKRDPTPHTCAIDKDEECDTISISCYLHKHIICSAHASPYDSGERSAHISQAGNKRRHPQPFMIDNFDDTHPASSAYDAIKASSTKLMTLALGSGKDDKDDDSKELTQAIRQLAAGITCFALFGMDYLVSKTTASTSTPVVKLCEVNSHPALGWGTMQKVPRYVFDELIQDTLAMVALKQSCKSTGYESILELESKHDLASTGYAAQAT